MGLWSRLTLAASALRGKMSPDDWWREFGGGTDTRSGIAVNDTTAMRVATVMACVRVTSEDVAKLPPQVYQLKGDGGRSVAQKHFLYNLFRQPNDWQTWFEFCEMMQVSLRMRGNAYAAVKRDFRGQPVAMIPLHPDRVFIYEAPGGEVFYEVARYGLHEMAELREFPSRIPAEDIFHLRWAASRNSLLGISPIGYARETIGLALGQEAWAAELIGNGARPSGVLQADRRLSDDAKERLRKSWDQAHGGSGKTGKTAILEEGLKWQALTLSSVDIEFIAGRRLQAELICQIFRVAPFKVGITEGVSARNVEQVQLQHYTDTVHPDLVRWEQKFQSFFDLPPEIVVSFDESQLLRADLAARANAARVLGMSGIMTPDENRVSFNLNPVGGAAKQLFMPVNMNTIENVAAGNAGAGAGLGSDHTGSPADGGNGDPANLPDVSSSFEPPRRRDRDNVALVLARLAQAVEQTAQATAQERGRTDRRLDAMQAEIAASRTASALVMRDVVEAVIRNGKPEVKVDVHTPDVKVDLQATPVEVNVTIERDGAKRFTPQRDANGALIGVTAEPVKENA